MGILAPALIALAWTAVAAVAAPAPPARLAVVGLAHRLDGKALAVTGTVENRGRAPVGALVIDAVGYSPRGEPVTFSSDGVPWTTAPGTAVPFSIPLPVPETLIKAYTVQVALARPPYAPLASSGREVGVAEYRPLIPPLIRLRGDLRGRLLTVAVRSGDLPVTRVRVEAKVAATGGGEVRFQVVRLDLGPDDTITVIVDVRALELKTATRLELVKLQVTDVALRTGWPD